MSALEAELAHTLQLGLNYDVTPATVVGLSIMWEPILGGIVRATFRFWGGDEYGEREWITATDEPPSRPDLFLAACKLRWKALDRSRKKVLA